MAVMTKDEIETLVTVLAEGGEARFEDLGYLLWRIRRAPTYGGACEVARRRTAPLIAAGALRKPGRGSVALTEKGRIAVALLVAADPWLREIFADDDADQDR